MTENFTQACELLKKFGRKTEDFILIVTPAQLEKMRKEGEVIDDENKTVNGIKFFFPPKF